MGLGAGQAASTAMQYNGEWLGKVELSQAFLELLKWWRQVLRSLGRQQCEDSREMREKRLDTQAEAGDFFRKTGYQKAFEQGGEASSFINEYSEQD